MGNLKSGLVGVAVGAAVYHAVNSFFNKGPRLVPEVVIDADISAKNPVFELRMNGEFPYFARKEESEDPSIVPMGLRLRNVGDSEAQNVQVGDVSVLGETAQWDIEQRVHVVLPGQVSDLMLPKFSGPSGLMAQDFPMKAYLESLYSSDKVYGKFFKGWEKIRENILKEALRDGDIPREEGWNTFENANYGKELTEYLDQFQSSADYIEDRRYPASATYEDRYGRKYLVEWDYTFHPINHHQIWGRLTMSDQNVLEGASTKAPGPCVTISSFRNHRA